MLVVAETRMRCCRFATPAGCLVQAGACWRLVHLGHAGRVRRSRRCQFHRSRNMIGRLLLLPSVNPRRNTTMLPVTSESESVGRCWEWRRRSRSRSPLVSSRRLTRMTARPPMLARLRQLPGASDLLLAGTLLLPSL